MSLEFDRRNALFAHMNTTTEKHGNKRVPVADLKFEMRIDNGILAHFHPLLRDSFFKRAEPEEGADLADQAAHPDQLLVPKFSGDRLGSIKWSQRLVGGTLTVHFGVSGRADIVIDDTKIEAFTLGFVDGGQVEMVFTVRGYPSGEQIARLYDLQRQSVEISFDPPSADYEPPLFEDDDEAEPVEGEFDDEDVDEEEAEEA
jgi:hypothetical protein